MIHDAGFMTKILNLKKVQATEIQIKKRAKRVNRLTGALIFI